MEAAWQVGPGAGGRCLTRAGMERDDQRDLCEKARAAANGEEKGPGLPQVPGTVRERVVGRARVQEVQDEDCEAQVRQRASREMDFLG